MNASPEHNAPQRIELLVRGCDIVCLDPQDTVVIDGAIAVDKDRILWIGSAAEASSRFAPESTIDAAGQVAMPGLIDAHVHTAQHLLRGTIAAEARGGKIRIPIWKNYYLPFEAALEPEDVHLSALLCYVNMITVGTTAFAEAGGPHPDEMGRAALETGIRGFIALSTMDQGQNAPGAMSRTRRDALVHNIELVGRWGGEERVKAWMSLRQIMVCSPGLIADIVDAARELGVKVHTHLCEGAYEIDYAMERFGMRPAEYLDSLGALGPHIHCAHSTLVSANEMDLYVARRPSACHCAFNNYHVGPHRLFEMWRRGIDVGLGTDGAGAWGPLDIFRVAHAARIGQQAAAGTPVHAFNVMSSEELIRVATNGGARALGLSDQIGSLEAGKKADIILLDADGMDQVPSVDPLFKVSTVAVGRDVRTVIIDGGLIMHNRELLTVDTDRLKHQLEKRLPNILERFGRVER